MSIIDRPTGVLPNGEKYFFLHIAKTAGSTFSNILNNLFFHEEICPAYYTVDLKDYTPEDLEKYQLYRGHISYQALFSLLPKNPNTFVFLRDPYEHAISLYSHIKRKDDASFLDNEIRSLRALTLRDYIFNPGQILSLEYANLQLRALTAKVRLENNKGITTYTNDFDDTTVDNLDFAREFLTGCSFVGLAEQFEEGMQLFSYTLGIRPIKIIPYINVADNKPKQIPADVYDMITRYSTLDLQLYAFARQLFDQRYTAMITDLINRFATPDQASLSQPLPKEILYELLEKHYQATFRERHKLVKSLVYRFDQPLVGDGWYDPEVNSDHGIYRWSGPDVVSNLDFPLASDSDLQIKFEVLMAITPTILDSLKLEIEGENIPLVVHPNPSGTLDFEGIIPASILARGNGLTRLNFKVKETAIPGIIYPGNPDKRQLGFALKRLEITPLSN